MDDDLVLAVRLTYKDAYGIEQVLALTDRPLPPSSPALADEQWQARLLGDVRWSEAARHPFMEQGGELSIGELAIANADGELDHLHDADVTGYNCEMRRGRVGLDRWADMEPIFVARNSQRRFNGRGEIVIELESVLTRLAGALSEAVFDDTAPNPQLEGKDIPLVLGRVKQAPVLEFDPAYLAYYTATNTSKIGQVAEGGNPTQRWTLEDQPTFNLLGSPTLPITADFEGPGDALVYAINDDFTAWDTGADTDLGNDIWALGDKPVGWSVYIKARIGPAFGASISSSAGLLIDADEGQTNFNFAMPFVGASSVPKLAQDGSSRVSWTGSLLIDPGSGSLPVAKCQLGINTSDDLLAEYSVNDIESLELGITLRNSVSNPFMTEIRVLSQSTEAAYPINQLMPDVDADGTFIKVMFEQERMAELGYSNLTSSPNSMSVRYVFSDSVRSDPGVVRMRAYARQSTAPAVQLVSAPVLAIGKTYLLRIEFENPTGDALDIVWGEAAVDAFGRINVLDAIERHRHFRSHAAEGVYQREFTASAERLVLQATKILQLSGSGLPDSPAASARIKSIKVIDQQFGTTKYPSLAPYILTTAGIDPALHLDQAAINAHADEAGDPDLGWLVKGGETVDQILYRLAGSLGGYVWAGLDGKVRSAALRKPEDPQRPHLIIDASRAEPDDVNSWQDPAPGLTMRVAALRNWQPIPPDRQAGITSTWTEENRAAAGAEWRITRSWQDNGRLEEFRRKWPNASARPPYQSALLTAADAQALANRGCDFYVDQPYWWEIDCVIRYGELDLIQIDRVVWVQLDYPGLKNGRWLRVFGRAGSGRGQRVTLTLHG